MDELPPLFGPGQKLGRYELVRRLAVGGMAEVYLATAVGRGDFRKVVAIKRLLPQHTLDPQLLSMFLDEARLMARLAHPHIPQVTDVDDGGTGEVPYFVMEYVHGTDLRGILNAAGGPLPIEHALAITGAVAAGLHHAHEQRGQNGQPLEIVHRDVSPSNILISFDGAVKITDFGVAKWSEQKSFTHQGQLKGKFAHMSPEQCRGESLDRRSDVFALGTLLYEMTTGHPPFAAESEYELLTQIVSRDAPAPGRPGDSYPPDLAAIVARSLGRSRDDRTASAQQLQLELEGFARKHQLVVSPVALTAYIESLFGARVTEWREALASGKTLADHLERAHTHGAAAAAAAERTETDAFARALPGALHTSTGTGNSRERPPGEPKPAPPAAAVEATSRFTVKRALAVAGTAALAATVLWMATELTSRWQNVSTPSLPSVRAVESMRPATAAEARALPTDRAATASRVTASAGSPPSPSSPIQAAANVNDSAAPRATGIARRGRDPLAASRPTRRVPVSAQAATPATDPASSPPVPAAAADSVNPAAPPAPSVKVWDPDSPVPP
ncbi:MAG: protein kinase [Haliangium ochraceum]